jgi:hypothetical protein
MQGLKNGAGGEADMEGVLDKVMALFRWVRCPTAVDRERSTAARQCRFYSVDACLVMVLPPDGILAICSNLHRRYLTEKDVFEKYYKQHLAKRLLAGRSVSDCLPACQS